MGFKLSFATALVVFATILYTGYAKNITCAVERCDSFKEITNCETWEQPQVCTDSVCFNVEGNATNTDKNNVTFTLKSCISEKIDCASLNSSTFPLIQIVDIKDLEGIAVTRCSTCDNDNCNTGSGVNALHTTMAVFMVPIIVLISKSIL